MPVVLLHESLGSVAQWHTFPAALCQALAQPVIAYDRLGFGQSDAFPGVLSADFVEQEAHGGFAVVRRHFGFNDFMLFGHSVGGGMAVHCAAAYPQACRAIVTEAAQAFIEPHTLAGIRAAERFFQDPAAFARLARYHGDKTRWVLNAWIHTWLSPEFSNWSLDAVLPGVRCPVLAIHGELDDYGSVEHARRICAASSGPAHSEILPAIRHVPHKECQDKVVALVARRLAALPV